MQRGLSKYWPWRVIAVLAVTTTLSCGTGIRDGDGYVYVNQLVDQDGMYIVLREATLNIKSDSLRYPPTLIKLHRFPTIEQAGAVSAVFEIEIPTYDTFTNDPMLAISTSFDRASNPSSKIGYLVPGVDKEQWVPDSQSASPACDPPLVCGPVQAQEFEKPGGTKYPQLTTTRLEFAIVTQCQSDADCPGLQNCSSNACQDCLTGTLCNPASP